MLTTNLIGRKVLDGFSGKPDGTIVAMFVDRGEPYVVVECDDGLSTPSDRTRLSVLSLQSVTLKPNE